jgi:hypothetical protein
MNGSALLPFVEVPPVPLKPEVPDRSGNVMVSTPLGSVAESLSVKLPVRNLWRSI